MTRSQRVAVAALVASYIAWRKCVASNRASHLRGDGSLPREVHSTGSQLRVTRAPTHDPLAAHRIERTGQDT